MISSTRTSSRRPDSTYPQLCGPCRRAPSCRRVSHASPVSSPASSPRRGSVAHGERRPLDRAADPGDAVLPGDGLDRPADHRKEAEVVVRIEVVDLDPRLADPSDLRVELALDVRGRDAPASPRRR